MSSTALTALTVLAKQERELPIPPVAVGLVAFGILLFLLFVTMTFDRDR